MPNVEAYPKEIQPLHPAKKAINIFQPSKNLAVTPNMGKLPKMIIGKIKAGTPEPQTHVIQEVKNHKKAAS